MKEALDAKAALQLVAREAGGRLVLHPPGRAWTTTTGADPASEVRWTAEWLRLRDSYDTDDLTRLAHAIRDAKIDSLYEGTTAIQAQDFFFRKIIRDKGQALAFVAGEIDSFIKAETGNGRLKADRALLATALEDVQGMAATLTGYLMAAQEDPKSIYKVGLGSVRFLLAVGDLVIGWLLLRQAAVAIDKLDAGAAGGEKVFYDGKVAAASFFAKNMLPLLSAVREVIETLDTDVMELENAAF